MHLPRLTLLPDILIPSLARRVICVISWNLEGPHSFAIILLLVELVVQRLLAIAIIIKVHIIIVRVIGIIRVVAVIFCRVFSVVWVEPHLVSYVVPRSVATDETQLFGRWLVLMSCNLNHGSSKVKTKEAGIFWVFTL